MRTRTIRTIGASVILGVVALAAIIQIGLNREEPADIVVTDAAPTTAHSAADQAEPQSPDTETFVYRVGVLSGVTTDNFWSFYGEKPSVWNSYVLGPTKPALFTSDPQTGTLRPELAAATVDPTFDENGWRVRVDLNPGLRWSDGTPVTAHDLVFTFETVRALDLGGSWSQVFPETIESIRAEGDHHVRIEFTERPQLSVWPHGVGLAPIMAKHVWAERVAGATAADLYAAPGTGDVGGGPLAIESVTDTLIVSVANAGYPLASPPERIEYHVLGDEAAAVAALDRGEVDTVLSPRGLADEHLSAIGVGGDVARLASPGNGVRYLGFNLDRAPMNGQAFRTALALLLDREAMAERIADGTPAWSLVPEGNSQWFDAKAAAANRDLYDGELPVRLSKALEALTGAGYQWQTAPSIGPDGKLVPGTGLTIGGVAPQPLTILTPGDSYDPNRSEYANEIAQALAVLGFDARPVETDFDTVVDLAFTPDDDGQLHYDMYLLGWTLGDPALPGYYGALFGENGPMNNTGYRSEAFSRALQAYESAFTTVDAFDALWEMERTLAQDLPYLLLYRDQITEVYRADRVSFDVEASLGGLQGRLGGIRDVRQTG